MPPFVSMTCWTTCTRNKRSFKKKIPFSFFSFIVSVFISNSRKRDFTSEIDSSPVHFLRTLKCCILSTRTEWYPNTEAGSTRAVEQSYKVKDSGCWLVSAHLTEKKETAKEEQEEIQFWFFKNHKVTMLSLQCNIQQPLFKCSDLQCVMFVNDLLLSENWKYTRNISGKSDRWHKKLLITDPLSLKGRNIQYRLFIPTQIHYQLCLSLKIYYCFVSPPPT